MEEVGKRSDSKIHHDFNNSTQNTKPGNTILHIAATEGDIETLKMFSNLGIDLELKNDLRQTPLHQISLAKENFSELFTWFTEQGVDINALDGNGDNLVFLSIAAGRPIYDLELLLKSGVHWSITNNQGRTVLHIAAAAGNLEALKYFKHLGANIEAKDTDGETPLFKIACAKQNLREMLIWFVEQEADVNAVNNIGDNLVFKCIANHLDIEVMEQVVASECDWQKRNKFGRSVLHYAVCEEHIEALKYFHKLGADLEAKDDYGRIPLHYVSEAFQNFKELLNLFVEKQVDINVVDDKGDNLILLSVRCGVSKQEIEQLVALGCEWNAKNADGQTAIQLAVEVGNDDILSYLKSLSL